MQPQLGFNTVRKHTRLFQVPSTCVATPKPSTRQTIVGFVSVAVQDVLTFETLDVIARWRQTPRPNAEKI